MWSCSHTTARRLGFMCFKEIFPFSVKFAEDLLQKICAFWGSSFQTFSSGSSFVQGLLMEDVEEGCHKSFQWRETKVSFLSFCVDWSLS